MNRITTYALFVFGSLLFVYTALKAYLLAITWDEAFSYLEFVRNGIFIEEKFNGMSANNHLLNTWMQILLVKCFGVHEFVLRIPALLTHLLFLIYSAKLVSHFHNKWLIIASFLILNLNPYLVDFFSMARGYGLSIGFMMASIYYLYVFHKELKTRMAAVSLIFSTLGVLSNFVLLNYMLSLYAVILFLYFYHSKIACIPTAEPGFLKKLITPTLIFLLSLAFILPVGLALKNADALYFGSSEGFWKGTVYSIVDRCFFELGYNYWLQRIAKAFMVVIIAGACIRSFLQIKRKQFSQQGLFLVSSLMLLGMCIISTVLQNWLFHTPYLLDRTALFLMVLFTVVLVSFVNEYAMEKSWAAGIAYVTAIITVIHMSLSLNLDYVLEWKLDMNTKEMLIDLEKIKTIPQEKSNVSLNIPLWYEQGINFYRDIYQLTWLNHISRSKKRNLLDDYYYLSPRELAVLSPDSIEILKTYPVTQNALVRPKYKPAKVKVCVNQELKFETEPNQQYVVGKDELYSKGFSYIVNDSITPHKQAVVVYEIESMITSETEGNLIMIIAMENSRETYIWKPANIKDYLQSVNTWAKASFTCILPAETKAGDKLSMYLWNPRKNKLVVKKMQFKWLEYQ